LNALKIISDLGEEYEKSIDNEKVLSADHREIAQDLMLNARSATEWANKAASFIRSVKMHGREGGVGSQQHFLVRDDVADAHGLVVHRLRTSSCRIEFEETIEGGSVAGDAGRFGQVLVNLISNAIDAYEERNIKDGRIEITTQQESDGTMRVRVREWAEGIPESVLPHIFDELYTTKGAGRGTGLSLWTSRNLVEQTFGGTLSVATTQEGSCFAAAFTGAAHATRSEDDNLFVLTRADSVEITSAGV
jgi:C4-dicarboxylate-specific signal transduction histidine kinase